MESIDYSEARVALSLAPSRRLAAFIVLAASATLALIVATPLPRWVAAVAAAWCCIAAAHALWTHARAGEVVIETHTIAASSFVSPWLTIVHYRPAGSRLSRTLVVLPDMLDAEDFRRLRVVLRWGLNSPP